MDGTTLTVEEMAIAGVMGGDRSLVERAENLMLLAELNRSGEHPVIAVSNLLHHAVRLGYDHLVVPEDTTRDPTQATRLDSDDFRKFGDFLVETLDDLIAARQQEMPWLADLHHDRSTKHYLLDGLVGRIMMRGRLAIESGRWAERPKRDDKLIDVACAAVDLVGVSADGRYYPQALSCESPDHSKRCCVIIVLRTYAASSTAHTDQEEAVRAKLESDPRVVQPVLACQVPQVGIGELDYEVIWPLALALIDQGPMEGRIDNIIIAAASIGMHEEPEEPTPLVMVVAQQSLALMTALVSAIAEQGDVDPDEAWQKLNAQAFESIVAGNMQFIEDIIPRDPTNPFLAQLVASDKSLYWAEMMGVHALARLKTVIAAGAWPMLTSYAQGNPETFAGALCSLTFPLVRQEREDDDAESDVYVQYLDGWFLVPEIDHNIADARQSATVVLGADWPGSTKKGFYQLLNRLQSGCYEGALGVRLAAGSPQLNVLAKPLIY